MAGLKDHADQINLLNWILQQPRLRIERWHHVGRKTSVSVWTQLDDEDEPSGKAPTTREALQMAMQHSLKPQG